MKRRAGVLFIIMMFAFPMVSAQNSNFERMNAYKIAMFTKKLNLTSREAEKFWPAYNEFQDKKIKIQRERMQLNRRFLQEGTILSEKEITSIGDKLAELEVSEAELAMTFHQNIKKILPPAKILKLYQAENQYRQQLLNELQVRRQGRNKPVQK